MFRILPKRIPKGALIRYASTDASTLPTLPHERNYAAYRQHSADEGFYWRSPYGSIRVPDQTLDQYVWQSLANWPNKVAIVCGVTGRQYTFAQLRDRCAAVAHRLRTEYGLKRGDVVAISLPNEPEYAIALLGAMEAGLAVTIINPAYTQLEHVKQLVLSGAKLIFGLAKETALLRASVAQMAVETKAANMMPVVVLRTNRGEFMPTGVRDFAELMSVEAVDFESLPAAGHQAGDVALIPFSSGTTGLPKGVQLTHRNIASNCEIIDMPLPSDRLIRPTAGDFQEVVPAVLPFYHIYGIAVLLISKLALGCKIVTLPRFEPSTFLHALEEHRATYLGIVPPLLLFLANDERAQRRHFNHVRVIMCGAAPSDASVASRLFEEKAPRSQHFVLGFGMTELVLVILSSLPNVNYESVGRPLPNNELKIVRLVEDGDSLDASERFIGVDANVDGELLIRGPTVMQGYLNNPDATAATMAPGGWLRTGDVASYTPDGQIFIRDRVKELIKVNGYPVAPAELEEVLRMHPLVLDAAVVGVKDPRAGEIPRAFVSVRRAVAAGELQSFVAARMVKYKWLTGGVQIVDSIPRSATGKLLRRQLR